MSGAAQTLLHAALKLPTRDRAQVAAKLLESLDGEDDVELETAWAAEVERRADEAERDPAVLVDWSVVKAEIERDLRRR
jgi:putative addiction module component (TIGR02574 family)